MSTEREDMFPHDDAIERMTDEQREKVVNERLRRLVNHAYQNAPYMKERFDKAGIDPKKVHSMKDLETLPILRKDDLVELHKKNPPFGGCVAVPLEKIRRVYQSPGPIYDPERRIKPESFWTGFGKGQIALNTWGYHLTPGGFIMDQVLHNMGCTVLAAGPGNVDTQLQIMLDLKVAGFVGAPSFLYAIIKKAEEKGHDFKKDFGLKWAMVIGEMGGDALRKMFKEKYDIHCLGDFYASADIGKIAASCEKDTGMHVTTDIIVEIVDPATGKVLGPNEVGEIVVTPFDEIYPLIRFGTGDLSCLITDTCACGRTSPRLPKIMGRTGDAVRVRAMFVHSSQTKEVVAKFPEIEAYQLVVTRVDNRDNMVMLVEVGKEPDDKEKWLAELDKEFRGTCKVRFDEVKFVPEGTIPAGEKAIVDKREY
jgi:phenylacetate-CoA ligase